ncbi:hypothetical protein [Brevibacillus sp. IT-7CA2]|uniref:hypothetical protein n=1 Tax=Brevibacillus sp. IT-7CA2 TaxID=3026436 RepID=UPI0039E1487A
MEDIKPVQVLMPLLGVIVGFLLGILRDWLLNKPKVKAEINTGEFGYYYSNYNDVGQYSKKQTSNNNANILEISLLLKIYNVGKSGTAIKRIILCVHNRNNNFKRYYEPEYKDNQSGSFNLNTGTIEIRHLNLKIKKEHEEVLLFEDIILDPDNEKSVNITVIIEDIFGKDVNVLVVPFSILTAYEDVEVLLTE